MDPRDPYVRLRTATALVRKKAGLRYRMAVVPLDPKPVHGSHGLLPAADADPADGPLIICSAPGTALHTPFAATDVKSLLLHLARPH